MEGTPTATTPLPGVSRVLLASKNQTWCTPEVVLSVVRQIGPIGLDPCSNPRSIVHARLECMLERGEDGLKLEWAAATRAEELVYVNPPFGRAIRTWVDKCCEEAARGVEIVLHLPGRLDTRWWRRAMELAGAWAMWSGRVTYTDETKTSAPSPFPTALIYFGRTPLRFVRILRKEGHYAVHRDGWRA